jgi:CHASE1-domain containing sensor protein
MNRQTGDKHWIKRLQEENEELKREFAEYKLELDLAKQVSKWEWFGYATLLERDGIEGLKRAVMYKPEMIRPFIIKTALAWQKMFAS